MSGDNCLTQDSTKHSHPNVVGSMKIIPHLDTFKQITDCKYILYTHIKNNYMQQLIKLSFTVAGDATSKSIGSNIKLVVLAS